MENFEEIKIAHVRGEFTLKGYQIGESEGDYYTDSGIPYFETHMIMFQDVDISDIIDPNLQIELQEFADLKCSEDSHIY